MDINKIEQRYKKISYYRKPEDLSIEEWQYCLRKQFAENHAFRIEKLGFHPVFTDYNVYNPETKLSYKVALRTNDNTGNFCECNDFKTNRLGTCKHIESVFHHLRNKAGKGELLDKPFEQNYSSIYLDYRLGRKIRIRIGSEDAPHFQLIADKYFDKDRILKPSEIGNFQQILNECKLINEQFRCYPDALAQVLENRESIKRASIVREKYEKHLENGAFDTLIQTRLFPYQKNGVCFAATKGRCIIADDMGLGKTIQAIAAAELLRIETGITSVYIICPTSLKYQWQTEIKKFTNQDAWVIDGIYTKRLDQYRNNSFYKIISYNTAVNDIKDINQCEPDLFILDEAQRIKNFKTKISQNIKKLVSPFAFVLTGTPLENKLEELYSIVQFVDPFVLGPYWKFMNDHRIVDETGKIKGYKDLNEIGLKLANTMIRRKKKDVLLQLPARMDKNLFVPMTEEQAAIHKESQDAVSRIINRWKRQGFLNEKDRQRLMINLGIMRMVCDSTYVLDQKTRFDTKIAELMNILDEVLDEGNEKVVIFSQWERMTRLIAAELDEKKVNYQYLHGGIPSGNRGKLFENFNNDPECKIFLSTDAGGVGLNLQAGSILINMDLPWNPAVLEQRIARIYRMGQNKNVSIINMVATGTIEHRMLGIIGFKKGLAEGILDQGENTIFMEEGKFKVLMNTIETMIESEIVPEAMPESSSESDEKIKVVLPEQAQVPVQLTLPLDAIKKEIGGDDDIVLVPDEKPEHGLSGKESGSTDELIKIGISFFGKLTETLSNPEKIKDLAASLVQKDEKDGKTYMKIPIQNEKTLENALNLLAGFLGNLKQ